MTRPHSTRTPKSCAWCGAPAVREIVVVHGAPKVQAVGGVYSATIDLPTYAPACDACSGAFVATPDPRAAAVAERKAAAEWRSRQLAIGPDWPLVPEP
jgi:hypothetical protein